MGKSVEQLYAEYEEVQTEYESAKDYYGEGSPEEQEYYNRKEEARIAYENALDAEQSNDEGGVSSEPTGQSVWNGEQEEDDWWKEEQSVWTNPDDTGGVSDANVCDPYSQSCVNEEEGQSIFCEEDDYCSVYVPCGPETTVVLPSSGGNHWSRTTQGWDDALASFNKWADGEINIAMKAGDKMGTVKAAKDMKTHAAWIHKNREYVMTQKGIGAVVDYPYGTGDKYFYEQYKDFKTNLGKVWAKGGWDPVSGGFNYRSEGVRTRLAPFSKVYRDIGLPSRKGMYEEIINTTNNMTRAGWKITETNAGRWTWSR